MAKKPEQIKSQVTQDLRALADLLKNQLNQICPDISPVYTAAENCGLLSDKQMFGYQMKGLNFRIAVVEKAIPKGLKDVSVKLSATVEGYCNPVVIDGNENVFNPVNKLEFNLIVNGKYNNGGTDKNVFTTWHLDRDEEDGRENQKYVHPFYHFQHGGRMLDAELSYGASLILNTPRIAHPPMDAALGIDFVLTNFIERKNIEGLRKNPIYKRIIKNSQDRIWKPYIMTLARAWEPEPDSTWCSLMLLPQLIK